METGQRSFREGVSGRREEPDINTLKSVSKVGRSVEEKAIKEKRNIVMGIIGDTLETLNTIVRSIRDCGYEVQIEAIQCDPVEAYERHLKSALEFLSCYFSEPYHIKWLLAAAKVKGK